MQPILVVFAVVAVPWMLLIKPFMLRREHKKALAAKGSTVHYDNTVCIQSAMQSNASSYMYSFVPVPRCSCLHSISIKHIDYAIRLVRINSNRQIGRTTRRS